MATALTAVFAEGIYFIILVPDECSEKRSQCDPACLKTSVSVGIGLIFIAFLWTSRMPIIVVEALLWYSSSP